MKVFEPTAGFTLAELMITILIIGVVMSIAIPSYVNARSNGQTKSCQENLCKIEGAKEQWALEHNAASGSTVTLAELMADYLRQGPKCPAGGTYDPQPVGTLATCSIGGTHVIH